MVFRTTLALEMEAEEPTIRNSNLLPVKAKGEVLLRSVASLATSTMVLTPVFSTPPGLEWAAAPVSIS